MATYGELIEPLHLAELRCDEKNEVELSELLVTLFKELYPFRHPSKDRIANLTIYGWKDAHSLHSYMKRIWTPKFLIHQQQVCCLIITYRYAIPSQL